MRARVWSPAPMLGSSQSPVALASGDWMPTVSKGTEFTRHTSTYKHISKNQNKSFFKKLKKETNVSVCGSLKATVCILTTNYIYVPELSHL